MLRPESELTEAQIRLQRSIYGTPHMIPRTMEKTETIEELVNKLADIELAASVKEASMKRATTGTDQRIADLEHALDGLKEHRTSVAAPFVIGIAEDKQLIDEIKAQIIDEWDGEKKTLVFDEGTLKFRTTQSLKIENETLVLTGLLDHTSIEDVARNYIKGFNLTAVKKYMGVLSLPMGAAWIDRKTTVKLEQKSG